MDASNPVFEGVRVKVSDFINENILLKRQDYAFLKALVDNGERVPVPGRLEEEIVINEAVVNGIVNEALQFGDRGTFEVPLVKSRDSVIVSKYHVGGLMQDKEKVRVKRKFLSRKRSKIMVKALMAYVPAAEKEIRKMVYTGGTIPGFKNRLIKWSTRKPKMMKPILAEYALDPFEVLFRRLPVKEEELLDWHRPIFDLISEVEVNKTTDAGPPFYAPKHKCFDSVLGLLKEIVQHISDGTFEKFIAENPEVMMSHCKNKMDRYEVAKINEKTRPYWSFCSSIMLLISVICQDFSHKLDKFDRTKHEDCSNAYGFSFAHGGGARMWKWMQSTKIKEPKFICYGDDTKLMWRKEGVLYEVNPDFVQMDGSVDRDTVELTVDYVLRCYTRRHGESKFFEFVGAAWKKLALGSEFFVEGTGVFSNNSGLLTGIVGTTLFDTVKSILAYETFIQARQDPADVEGSIQFFKKMGLEVKPGTWQPVPVRMELEEGAVATDQKFLGVSLVVIQGKHDLEPVPFMDEDDLVKLMGNIRQPVEYKGTADVRRMFDTARGYMVSATFHHKRLWSACAKIIDETPAEVICQRIQSSTNGEQPEFPMLTDEGFVWPSSDGFPTIDFCKDVFLDRDNMLGGKWLHVFPNLEAELKEFRGKREYLSGMKPNVAKEQTGDWVKIDEVGDVETKFRRALNPHEVIAAEDDMDILPNRVFRMPRNLVKFKPRGLESMKRKEEKLREVMDSVDEVHNQYLGTVMPYGQYWITAQILKLGSWYPTAHGFWTKDQKEWMKSVTKAWPYDARRAFLETERYGSASIGEPTSTVPSLNKEVDVQSEGVILEKPEIIRDLAEDEWDRLIPMPPGTDSISYITSQFAAKGMRLVAKNRVLSQQPSRIEVTVEVKEGDKWIGTAVSSTAKLAKMSLYRDLHKMIEYKQWPISMEKLRLVPLPDDDDENDL